MSPPSHKNRLYLDCPFEDKDEVKKLGARWDAGARRWFVPPDMPCRMFAAWLDKTYLDTTYEEKDEVKKLGAKWDAKVKRWYVPSNVPENPFEPWLGMSHEEYDAPATPEKKKKPPRPMKTTSTSVHVSKHTSVEYHVHMTQENDEEDEAQLKKRAAKKPPRAASVSASKRVKSKRDDGFNSDAGKNYTTNLLSLPRVSASNMTISQLSAELLARQPLSRGLSNKNKDWFLEQLGEGSIWTTACSDTLPPDVPKVSAQMTIAQLTSELITRQPWRTTGLSSKTKDWFLQQLVLGSVWMTSTSHGSALATPPVKTSTKKTSSKAARRPSTGGRQRDRPYKIGGVRSFDSGDENNGGLSYYPREEAQIYSRSTHHNHHGRRDLGGSFGSEYDCSSHYSDDSEDEASYHRGYGEQRRRQAGGGRVRYDQHETYEQHTGGHHDDYDEESYDY